MKEKFLYKKIQKRFPGKENIWFEIKYSLLFILITAIYGFFISWARGLGWTKMYDNISDYGTPYFIFSIIALIFLHDTYFYWGHRFMHLKKVYPIVHQVHHHSINPTPWAAYSFHPLEGFIEAGFLLIVFLMPIHIIALFIFLGFSTFFNVYGHLGYELFKPRKEKGLGFTNTATHHNMHHSFFNCNYGIYFNFWDKLMKTNHEKYYETFEKNASAKPAKLP
jgi:sterol desaturase/sphingolipid hydroxylase (fatty acid hydroxylase superfamily)